MSGTYYCGVCRQYIAPTLTYEQHDATAAHKQAFIEAGNHVCDWKSTWPTGHPLPPELPGKLQGPEIGEFVIYTSPITVVGSADIQAPRVVRVIHRSYVWSPGECRSQGGHRHYDWKVVEEGPNEYRSVVVDDKDLTPLPDRTRVIYALKELDK